MSAFERSRSFSAHPHSVFAARTFVLDAAPWVGDGAAEVVAMVVSEVATNAVVHARTPFAVTVAAGPDHTPLRLRVEVSDTGDGQPVVRHPLPIVPHGRGLQIVEVLAESWGVIPQQPGPGKTVWFEL